jgi:RHS repeat-associated protein
MAYRYGFNGKEKDSETANDNYDFGARIYDGRLGRWLSLDPLMKKYVSFSSYCFSINRPLYFKDPDGQDIIPSPEFNASKYGTVLKNLINSNSHFNLYTNNFQTKAGYELTFDFDESKVISGTVATTYYNYNYSTIFKLCYNPETGFFTPTKINKCKGITSAAHFKTDSDVNVNDLGRVTLIAHEYFHAHAGLFCVSGSDVNHDNWDEYVDQMQEVIEEYCLDNNIQLECWQIFELSIFNAGSDSKIVKSYIEEKTKVSGLTFDDELYNFNNRIDNLVLETPPAIDQPEIENPTEGRNSKD